MEKAERTQLILTSSTQTEQPGIKAPTYADQIIFLDKSERYAHCKGKEHREAEFLKLSRKQTLNFKLG